MDIKEEKQNNWIGKPCQFPNKTFSPPWEDVASIKFVASSVRWWEALKSINQFWDCCVCEWTEAE